MGIDPNRERVRTVLTRLLSNHHPGPARDIAIVASARSGSTWLMEALADQPGYKYINEPDHRAMLEFHHAVAITMKRWNWLCLSDAEAAELRAFLTNDRRSGLFGPVRPHDIRHHWRTSRRVLKLIRMSALIEWLADIGFLPVLLVRHPIPQSLSCIARGHVPRLPEFLEAECFRDQLTDEQVEQVRAVVRSGDQLSTFVTHWCLQNLIPLRSSYAGTKFAVSAYETRILQPHEEIARLADFLQVPEPARLRNFVRVPSRVTDSSASDTVASIRSGHADTLVSSWRASVSTDRESQLMGIVATFGIEIYRDGDELPHLAAQWT